MSHAPHVIAFGGLPGTGKGTQVNLLRQLFPHLQLLSMGALLRTRYPEAYAEYLRTGIYMSDTQYMFPSVQAFLDEHATSPVVMDGFPRRQSQAEWLVKELAARGRPLVMLYYKLSTPPEETFVHLWQRVRNRTEARTDDDETNFRIRFSAGQKYDAELVSFFHHTQLPADMAYMELDASRPIADIHASTLKILQSHNFPQP